ETRYQYGFSIDSQAMLEEWLFAHPRGGRRQTWFKRHSGKPMVFSPKMGGDLRAARVIETLTRKNSLFLSAAAQNNFEPLLPIYSWFVGSLYYFSSDRRNLAMETAQRCLNEDGRKLIAGLLGHADLGIS